ncbi:unnamed protein product [Litomosoides sigmodontis]|uniref:Uncharacterized protein n=1 Tax=Litomosoides sigmodontis TaxID=42156 RepID=A0A3P6U299_LITSI|nr:unnamed protein product [Litomosoides sigmodontis]
MFQPADVLNMPVAAFKFGIKEQGSRSVQNLEFDKECVIRVTSADDDGIYWGTVVLATQHSTMQKIRAAANSHCESESSSASVATSVEESLKFLEEKLREKNERSKFEQEYTLQTMQLQVATVLKSLNAISIPFTPYMANICDSFPNPTEAHSSPIQNTDGYNPSSSYSRAPGSKSVTIRCEDRYYMDQ